MPGQCSFNPAWAKDPQFKDWLEAVTGKPTQAKCRVCMKQFSVANGGIAQVKIHAKGEKHKKGRYFKGFYIICSH